MMLMLKLANSETLDEKPNQCKRYVSEQAMKEESET